LFERITLKNFLSFRGPAVIDLAPINIIIGANGVGKSNLLRAFEVLQALPRDLSRPIGRLGGGREILWKGEPGNRDKAFELRVRGSFPTDLAYELGCLIVGSDYAVSNEELSSQTMSWAKDPETHYFSRSFAHAEMVLAGRNVVSEEISLEWEEMSSLRETESVFQQVRGPMVRDDMRKFSDTLDDMKVYDRWNTSRNGPMRGPQPTERVSSQLLPDGSNLALVVSHLESENVTYKIEEHLKCFNPRIKRISSSIQGNSVQVYFSEGDLSSAVPAAAVSDGTLQYLGILCVLLNPTPSPLVCFEEPECGLHPEAIPLLADLFREASEHTQVVVTTHSDRLVDCFSDAPECVLVAERDSDTGETTLERLDRDELAHWLEKYRLGMLWTKGQIGGVIR
jgi:predicted ATPase